jgi:hypothetical protein
MFFRGASYPQPRPFIFHLDAKEGQVAAKALGALVLINGS